VTHSVGDENLWQAAKNADTFCCCLTKTSFNLSFDKKKHFASQRSVVLQI